MSEVPTIRVKSGDSYAIINESDYDEATHTLYKGAVEDAPVPDALADADPATLISGEGGDPGALVPPVDHPTPHEETLIHGDAEEDAPEVEALKVAELREELARRGVEVPEGALKADLRQLLIDALARG